MDYFMKCFELIGQKYFYCRRESQLVLLKKKKTDLIGVIVDFKYKFRIKLIFKSRFAYALQLLLSSFTANLMLQ